ncbi:MAG: GGDEF domain-containing protein [Methylophilaceae bacterium]
MPQHNEEDIASNALELLSTTSTWLLVRHQWLIDNMRCLLTGEPAPALTTLKEFDDSIPKLLKLPDNLMANFTEVKSSLEKSWLEVTKATHPMSGLTVFEQLNNFQTLANSFMQTSKEANQKLLHEFAMRDSLTGAWTRLTLNSNLSKELCNSTQDQEPCSIALLDQDSFKVINDRWGHVAGDQALAKTAEIIQNNLRPTDKLFRFGGDEWLLLMPATSEALANTILKRVQAACSTHEFKSNNNESFFSTFSYGIAESNGTLTPLEWVTNADKQLYKDKNLQGTTVQQYAEESQPRANAS